MVNAIVDIVGLRTIQRTIQRGISAWEQDNLSAAFEHFEGILPVEMSRSGMRVCSDAGQAAAHTRTARPPHSTSHTRESFE